MHKQYSFETKLFLHWPATLAEVCCSFLIEQSCVLLLMQKAVPMCHDSGSDTLTFTVLGKQAELRNQRQEERKV